MHEKENTSHGVNVLHREGKGDDAQCKVGVEHANCLNMYIALHHSRVYPTASTRKVHGGHVGGQVPWRIKYHGERSIVAKKNKAPLLCTLYKFQILSALISVTSNISNVELCFHQTSDFYSLSYLTYTSAET